MMSYSLAEEFSDRVIVYTIKVMQILNLQHSWLHFMRSDAQIMTLNGGDAPDCIDDFNHATIAPERVATGNY